MFIIRPIELQDVDVVFNYACQLAKRTGVKPSNFILTKEKLKTNLFCNVVDWYGLVIEQQGKVLGSCLYSFANIDRIFNSTKCIFLDLLFVNPQYRRHKLGKRLVEELKKIAVNEGVERIEFLCMKDNIIAHKFYNVVKAQKKELFDIYVLKTNM